MTRSLFRLPGVFLSWELVGGANPVEVVDRCASAGIRWIAQQYGDPKTEPAEAQIGALREECHLRSVYFGGWSVGVRLDLLALARPNLWVFNVETDMTDYSPLLHTFRAHMPHFPAGVVTDCGLNAGPFIEANVKCLPECYAGVQGQNPVTMPANMVARAHELGWKVVFPVMGVFDGGRLSSYERFGDGWSVYLYDGMTDDDFATARSWCAT